MTVPSAKEQMPGGTPADSRNVDFIRRTINDDLNTGKHRQIVTRFPPEPNGFLHIGHAKSICLNFGIALEYGGICHLRFDDTDPAKEDTLFEESIQADVRWLGFDWKGKLFHASDYFETMYDCAIQLIRDGKAYVCSLSEAEIREYRGTVTEPGKPSPYRERSIDENLELFQKMRRGEFKNGEHVLRAKIDMASPNMKMRDPLLYRIRHVSHHMTGDTWCIYPMYDFAHPISDALECITHSLCTLEFENNRELYDWVVENLTLPSRPVQIEFARLNLNYTVMSKRRLLTLVEGKYVNGWDDPRLPTISGLRRRGYTPEAIRNFCESVGIAKANSVVDMAQLEYCIRDDLNTRAPRVLCVLKPLKVVIENWPEGKTEEIDAPYYPEDVPKEGSRKLTFSREVYIEQNDFMEEPPKGYHRLSPGAEVRLRYGYVIRCEDVIKDARGNVVELRCSYDPATGGGAAPEGRKVKGVIHWVSADHSSPAEVRLYDRLLTVPNPDAEKGEFTDYLNPDSLQVLSGCRIEAAVAGAAVGDRFQFERQGYFCVDPDSKPGNLVFNRIVTLRDSWAKQVQKTEDPPKPEPKKEKPKAEPRSVQADRPEISEKPLTPQQEERLNHYRLELGLPYEDALLLAQDPAVSKLFEDALARHDNAKGLANWINNELLRELKDRPVDALPFGGAELAELVVLMDDGTISSKIAKDVFADMLTGGGNPKAIVEKKDLRQMTDPAELQPVIDGILAANPDSVAKYRGGNDRLFGFFVGQVMKQTGGRANPELLNRLLRDALKG